MPPQPGNWAGSVGACADAGAYGCGCVGAFQHADTEGDQWPQPCGDPAMLKNENSTPVVTSPDLQRENKRQI